jgi:hypothetical protein
LTQPSIPPGSVKRGASCGSNKVRISHRGSVRVAGNSVCGPVSTLGPGALRLARICAYQNPLTRVFITRPTILLYLQLSRIYAIPRCHLRLSFSLKTEIRCSTFTGAMVQLCCQQSPLLCAKGDKSIVEFIALLSCKPLNSVSRRMSCINFFHMSIYRPMFDACK